MTTAEQAPPRAPARLREFSAVAASGACVAFVIMGMVQAFYGPAIPALRTHFHISPSIVGTALTAHFTGALLGVVVSFCYRKVLSDRWSLACSYALMAAGAAGFALAPWWPGALASAFVLGLGFGGLDYGLNRMFASGFGTASPALLNLLNAFFGVGAILGPALIGWLSPQRYAVAFGGCGLVCAILVGSAAGKRDPARSNAGDDTGERQASRAALRRETPAMRSADASPQIALRRSVGIVAAFVVIYVLHVAIETGVGAWEPTHLVSLGRTPQAAATATALYWLTMTAGRFACIALSVRWPAGRIVTLSCLAMAAALALAAVPGLTVYAYAAVGLAIAPIFPTGLIWLRQAVPERETASAFVIAAAMVGGIAFPPLLGGVIQAAGVKAVPWVLCLLATCCLAAACLTTRQVTAKRQRPPTPADS